jgi:soluble lytic murein transglycosylase
VRRLALLGILVAILVGVGVGVWRAQPDLIDRILYPLEYDQIVRTHARNYGLDPAMLAAVIYTESRFKPNARSAAGALGLMQLLPDTARGIALRTGGHGFVVDDLFDPEINVRYGSWYLRNLLQKYDDERLALAAYHAGQGNVDGWLERGVDIQFPETRAYVEKVLSAEKVYRSTYGERLGLD